MNQLQDIFDRVVHQAKLGKKSHNRSHCLYRDDNGNKCFIGCLINDEVYSEDFECTVGVCSETIIKALRLSGWNIDKGDTEELSQLQHIHDAFNPSEWCEKLKDFSKTHNLKFSW